MQEVRKNPMSQIDFILYATHFSVPLQSCASYQILSRESLSVLEQILSMNGSEFRVKAETVLLLTEAEGGVK